MRYLDIHTHQPSVDPTHTLAIRSFDLRQVQELSAWPGYSSIGLHPWFLHEYWPTQLTTLAQQLAQPRTFMLGEAGLDRLRGPELSLQLAALEAQALLAQEASKPLLLHIVRAFEEVQSLHARLNPTVPWIIHGFRKRAELAQALLQQGFYLSFGAHLLQASGSSAACFAQLPPQRLLLETDDASTPMADLYTRAAELRGLSPQAWAAQLQANWTEVFGGSEVF